MKILNIDQSVSLIPKNGITGSWDYKFLNPGSHEWEINPVTAIKKLRVNALSTSVTYLLRYCVSRLTDRWRVASSSVHVSIEQHSNVSMTFVHRYWQRCTAVLDVKHINDSCMILVCGNKPRQSTVHTADRDIMVSRWETVILGLISVGLVSPSLSWLSVVHLGLLRPRGLVLGSKS